MAQQLSNNGLLLGLGTKKISFNCFTEYCTGYPEVAKKNANERNFIRVSISFFQYISLSFVVSGNAIQFFTEILFTFSKGFIRIDRSAGE